MATSHQLGQYRFNGGCASKVTGCTIGDYNSEIDVGGEEDNSSKMTFTDFCITNQKGFDADTDYYARVDIPPDLNNEYTFTIKLVKGQGQSASTGSSYQFIKKVTLKRGGAANNLYDLCLYNANPEAKTVAQEKVVATVLDNSNKYGADNPTIKNKLYWQGEGQKRKYYLGAGGKSYIVAKQVVKASLTAAWRTEQLVDKKSRIEFVFRPMESGFSQIVFTMARGAEDYGLINGEKYTDNGKVTIIDYGRKIDTTKVDYEIYRLTNIVSACQVESFDSIGVWGHPEQMMAINGEQIQIGPSGFYELTGLDIESLGVVAFDDDYIKSNFTVDYEYTKED